MSGTSVELLPKIDLLTRTGAGLMVPMHHSEGLVIVDCGDDRPITEEQQTERIQTFGADIAPGRYFGASTGLAITAMIGFAPNMAKRQ